MSMTVPTEEPPQASGPTYGSMDVSQIRIHSEPVLDIHSATKKYVDDKAAAVVDSLTGPGTSAALDHSGIGLVPPRW